MGDYKVIQVGFSDAEFNDHVDEETKKKIKKKYSIEDELKLIRKALKKMGLKDTEFNEYDLFVEQAVAEGKAQKQKASTGKPIIVKPYMGKGKSNE
jgi:hypothetical protein